MLTDLVLVTLSQTTTDAHIIHNEETRAGRRTRATVIENTFANQAPESSVFVVIVVWLR